jgi:hypothetical protein
MSRGRGAVVIALFALVGCTQGELLTEAAGVDTPIQAGGSKACS